MACRPQPRLWRRRCPIARPPSSGRKSASITPSGRWCRRAPPSTSIIRSGRSRRSWPSCRPCGPCRSRVWLPRNTDSPLLSAHGHCSGDCAGGPPHMKALFVLVVGLGAPGILPSLAVARRSPVLVFLAPLAGAGMVAVAAEIELGVGGSLVADYVVVAVAANLAVTAWWLAAGRSRQPWAGPSWGWSIVHRRRRAGCRCRPPERPARADDRRGRQLNLADSRLDGVRRTPRAAHGPAERGLPVLQPGLPAARPRRRGPGVRVLRTGRPASRR